MPLRKALAYSKKYARPYTRKSKIKRRAYIKTVPPQKVVKFNMGNIGAYNEGKYKVLMKLSSKESVQIRDNALEACRQVIHKFMEKLLPGNYFLALKKYPHHIIRENKMYSGGSKGERVNQGMQQSYGAAIGRAAFAKAGEDIFVAAFEDKRSIPAVRKIFDMVTPKLPCAAKISVEIVK